MPAIPSARAKVLVVDDEADIREAVAAAIALALPDVDVEVAADGLEALACLERGPVDLVVTDHKMPGMTGLELVAKMASVAPTTARVMMTAYADTAVATSALNDGHVRFFLTKPLRPTRLLEVVQNILNERAETMARERAFARVGTWVQARNTP